MYIPKCSVLKKLRTLKKKTIEVVDLGYKFVYYLHLVKLAFFGRKNEKGIVLEKELKRAEIMLGSTPNL